MDQINVDVIVSNGTNVQVNSPSTSVDALINLPPPLSPTVTSPTYDTQACVVLPQGPIGPVGPSGAIGPSGIPNTGELDLRYVNLTGDQNISGIKDFYSRPTVNGTGVLLSGEGSTIISGVLYSAQINIKNDNGSTIYKGQPVYVSSAAGTNILVKLANNTGEQTSSKTLGLVYQTSLAQNSQGTIVTEGLLQGFNTNAGQEGDPIWLGPTGSLIFGLANKPYAPNHLVYLGVVTRKHVNQGEVFVKIQNGFELEELHNVNINHKNALNDNNILRYISGSGLWFNDTINSVLPNTIVYTTGDQTISGNKTFINNIGVQGTGIFNALDLSNISEFNFSGTDINLINGNVYISGGTAYISGNPVLTGVNLSPYATVTNLNLTGANLDFLKENHIIEKRSLVLNPFATNPLPEGRNASYSFTFNGALPSYNLRLPNVAQTGDKLYLSLTTPSTSSVLIYNADPGPGWSLYTTIPPSTKFIQAFYVSDFFFSANYPIWTPMKDIMGYLDTSDSISINSSINTLSGISVLRTGNQIINGNKTFNNLTSFNSGVSLQNSYLGIYMPAVSSASTFTHHWFIDTAGTSQQEMWLDGISGVRAFVPLQNTVYGVNLNIVGIQTGLSEPAAANYNLNFMLSRKQGGGNSNVIYNPTVISSGSSANNPFQVQSGFYHSASGFFIKPEPGFTSFRLFVTPSSSTRTVFKAFGVINSLCIPT